MKENHFFFFFFAKQNKIKKSSSQGHLKESHNLSNRSHFHFFFLKKITFGQKHMMEEEPVRTYARRRNISQHSRNLSLLSPTSASSSSASATAAASPFVTSSASTSWMASMAGCASSSSLPLGEEPSPYFSSATTSSKERVIHNNNNNKKRKRSVAMRRSVSAPSGLGGDTPSPSSSPSPTTTTKSKPIGRSADVNVPLTAVRKRRKLFDSSSSSSSSSSYSSSSSSYSSSSTLSKVITLELNSEEEKDDKEEDGTPVTSQTKEEVELVPTLASCKNKGERESKNEKKNTTKKATPKKTNPKKQSAKLVSGGRRGSGRGSKDEEHEDSLKSSFELEQSGEQASILDELEYLLDGVSAHQPLAVRRGSTFELAKLCMNPEAGHLLRAHGLFPNIFALLEDNILLDDGLAIASAAIIYFVFKDSLNSNYITEKCILSLLNLLSSYAAASSTPSPSRQRQKNIKGAPTLQRRRSFGHIVEDVVLKIQNLFIGERFTKPLSHHSKITPSFLALEALIRLSRTGCKAFEEAIRLYNGLDQLAKLIDQTLPLIPALSLDEGRTNSDMEKEMSRQSQHLHRLESYLQLLENVTNSSTASKNQQHLISTTPAMIPSLLRTLSLCEGAIKKRISAGASPNDIVSCLAAAIKVLINLSNENEAGCEAIVRNRGMETISSLLSLEVLKLPCERFDVILLTVCLLINIVEKNQQYKAAFRDIEITSETEKIETIPFLVNLYIQRRKKKEKNCDIVNDDDDQPLKKVENRVMASYVALLLGCLARGDDINKDLLLCHLPSGSFDELSAFLRKFLAFQSESGVLSKDVLLSVAEIVQEFTKYQQKEEQRETKKTVEEEEKMHNYQRHAAYACAPAMDVFAWQEEE
ncbi:hypothetical protein QOT17_015469 [Balamuthia mandrillaris]